jgi:hypothetical protein
MAYNGAYDYDTVRGGLLRFALLSSSHCCACIGLLACCVVVPSPHT